MISVSLEKKTSVGVDPLKAWRLHWSTSISHFEDRGFCFEESPCRRDCIA